MHDRAADRRRDRASACYNPAMKECPLCGESMRLSVREIRDIIPGSGESPARVTREWICPECDYFEEAEAGEE
jgi:acetone carboxylase gamma subunit